MRPKNKYGKFVSKEDVEVLEADDPLDELLAQSKVVRPIVEYLPPNFRLVMCTVGPHKKVRVMVRPNNQFYLKGMVIPLDVDLSTFDPTKLLIFNGNPPRRKGMW